MELVDITPEDSIVPVYLEVLSEEEQAERDAQISQAQANQEAREQEIIAKEEAKARGIAILQSLGLDEEAAKAIAGI
jgi:hypothetical protein